MKYSVALPIDDFLDEIVDSIKNNRVTIVAAETGAGKTTRVGQAVISRLARLKRVTQTLPRRAAVLWNSQRIADEMGVELGTLVGWRLAGESPMVSEATRLTLRIDRSVLNQIRKKGGVLPKGLLIIDEAHDRSIDIDLLLGLIKEGLPTAHPSTRVVIMSATIDTERFSAFFDGAPVISVPGRCYPVATSVVPLEYGEHHSQGAGRQACWLVDRFLANEFTIPGTTDHDLEEKVSDGTVIVLLPGKEDIRQVVAQIERHLKDQDGAEQVEILTCHGESTAEELTRAQSPIPPCTLRVVVGTEVLRTSITLPQVVAVVDSLQVKRYSVDPNGVGHLVKIAVSKADAQQAAGRAGRTQPGRYYPVSYNNEFHYLEQYPLPAILRSPVTSAALQVAAVGRSIRNFPLLDRPSEEKIEVAIDRLQRIGALNEDESITDLGQLLSNIPLDPELARVLVEAHGLSVAEEAAIVLAAFDNSLFFLPKGKDQWETADLREQANKKRRQWSTPQEGDFVGLVRAYRTFKGYERELWDAAGENPGQKKKQAIRDEVFEWCKERFLSIKGMRRVTDTLRLLKEELSGSSIEIGNASLERPFEAESLNKALISGFIDRIAQHTGQGWYDAPVANFRIGNASVMSTEWPQLVITGPVQKVPTRRGGQFHLTEYVAMIEPTWLLEVVPQLCQTFRRIEYIPQFDQCREVTGITLSGREVLREENPVLDATESAEAFAVWLSKRGRDWAYTRIDRVAETNWLHLKDLVDPDVLEKRLVEHYRTQLRGASTFGEFAPREPEELLLPDIMAVFD